MPTSTLATVKKSWTAAISSAPMTISERMDRSE